MIRRLVEWVKYLLGKRKPSKPAIECLMEIVPMVFASMFVIGLFKSLGIYPKFPWYKRVQLKLRSIFTMFRWKVVGY